MIITAVVPIRKGSQRIKNKNFRPFAKSSLLEIKLNALKEIEQIDNIIVNTDSDKAIEIAKQNGVNFFKRDEYFASSNCINTEHWKNLADTTETDFLMHCPCTAPLIKKDTYEDIINTFKTSLKNGFDSINSVASVKEFLWLNNKPINYEINNVPNSQNLPDIFKLTFGVSIIDKKLMSSRRNVVGSKPYFFELDQIESVDIDNYIDFEFAEFLYKKFSKR